MGRLLGLGDVRGLMMALDGVYENQGKGSDYEEEYEKKLLQIDDAAFTLRDLYDQIKSVSNMKYEIYGILVLVLNTSTFQKKKKRKFQIQKLYMKSDDRDRACVGRFVDAAGIFGVDAAITSQRRRGYVQREDEGVFDDNGLDDGQGIRP